MATTGSSLYRGVPSSTSESITGIADLILGGEDRPTEWIYPQLAPEERPSKRGGTFIRPPDVDINEDGTVEANGKGTSMHDKAGFFGWSETAYFCIPEGTKYSEEQLDLHRSKKKKKPLVTGGYDGKAYHYNVCPKVKMTPDALRGALDNLGRAAIARANELGVPVIYRSSDSAGAPSPEPESVD